MTDNRSHVVVSVLYLTLCLLILPTQASAKDTLPDFLKPGTSQDEPLRFQKIEVLKRTKESLKIRWRTNHAARGKIEFRRGQSLKQGLRSSLRPFHEVTFDSLVEGTRYRFRVFAWDEFQNRIKSQVVAVKTRGMPPPRFQSISVTNRTMYGGTVKWVTNVPTRSTFRAGHDTPLKQKSSHSSPRRHHGVKLTRFYPDQPLFYRLTITDTRGRKTTTGLKSFRTREANFALNKPVQGTFDRPIFGVKGDTGQTPYIERVTDGSYNYAKGTANSGNPSDTHQHFIINLEQLIKPGRAVLYWRDLAYPKHYEIYGSRFKNDWTKLSGNLNAADGEHVSTPTGGMRSLRHRVQFSDTVPNIQFVKVKIPKGSPYYGKYPSYEFLQLFEFKIFPREVPNPENKPDNSSLEEIRSSTETRPFDEINRSTGIRTKRDDGVENFEYPFNQTRLNSLPVREVIATGPDGSEEVT